MSSEYSEAAGEELEPASKSAGHWSMKLLYLWFFIATAFYVTYVGLYLRSLHLSGAQIGLIASVVPLGGVALQPLWGLLSDRKRWRKQLLVGGLLCASLAAPLIALSHQFVPLLLLSALLSIALSPVIPLSDATTLESITRLGGTYGAVRLFGSGGFIIGSLAAGPALSGSRLAWLFPLYGGLLGVTCAVALAAPGQARHPRDQQHLHLGIVLRNRSIVIFLLLVMLGFGASASYNTFFSVYMHDLGASTTVIGVAAAIASLSELPVMALSGRVMARMGVKPLLLAGFGVAAVRWLSYGFIHDYRLVLPLQVLHGLTFGAAYVGGVNYMERSVPSQLRATGQTLFSGATFGLGAILGANVFGLLFDRVQATGMYLAAGLLCGLVSLGVLLLVREPWPALRDGEAA